MKGRSLINSYLLIIGAMKSGTTTLFDHLSRHPQIAPCVIKEPTFFCFDEVYERGFDWYENQFEFASGRHTYAMEASTDYTKFPYCGESVVKRLGECSSRRFKLIYQMRHPLRRIESHARHAQRHGAEVGMIVSDRMDHTLDSGISPVAISVSDYAAQLDRFEVFFQRGDLLLLTLEDLSANPSKVIMQICEFLQIDPMVLDKGTLKASNETRSFRRNHPIWQIFSRSFVSNIAKAIVPGPVRETLRSITMLPDHVEGRFKLNPEEEQAILEKLAPGLQRLSSHYGIDVEKKWGIKL